MQEEEEEVKKAKKAAFGGQGDFVHLHENGLKAVHRVGHWLCLVQSSLSHHYTSGAAALCISSWDTLRVQDSS